ncbi:MULTISPECIES: hypothetical protein [unclassified Pseudoalteromonas]|uniref:hypothetical protein n=1 Tax=unclassified Pseudoalteromonas TaxID=194690 RepID=UPI0025B5EFF4|nr:MULTISPECIES: hypothetical protein [unclassified Pseudoalteromonas]MDN3379155.1 hypothetical protein [Pseudoalteromonas sp. APC 3893]MDN3387650.1 hypothetical protein [Pseudoalteromonas sp. APC 4017]
MTIADFNKDWVEYLVKNIKSIKLNGILSRMIKYMRDEATHIVQMAPIPLLIDEREFFDLQKKGNLLKSAVMKMYCKERSELDHETFLKEYAVPAELEFLVDWESLSRGFEDASRFDIIQDTNGQFFFIEFNVGSTVGGYQSYPPLKSFMDEFDFPYRPAHSPAWMLMQRLANVCRTQGINKVVFFGDSLFESAGYLSKGVYREVLESVLPGIEIVFVTETNIREHFSKGQPIAMFNWMPLEYMDKHIDIFKEAKRCSVQIVSGIEANVLSNKKWVAKLHDEQNFPFLTAQEIEAVQVSIPYSFILTQDNKSQVIAQKDKYIFKVTNSMGGDQIYVGKDKSVAFLDECLDLTSEWIVQELKETVEIEIPVVGVRGLHKHKFVLGLFNHGEISCGLDIRLSQSSSIVNVTTGAISSVAFPTSEQDKLVYIEQDKLQSLSMEAVAD